MAPFCVKECFAYNGAKKFLFIACYLSLSFINFLYSVGVLEDLSEILKDVHHVWLDIVETGQLWRDTVGQRGNGQWSSSIIVETETLVCSIEPPFH